MNAGPLQGVQSYCEIRAGILSQILTARAPDMEDTTL